MNRVFLIFFFSVLTAWLSGCAGNRPAPERSSASSGEPLPPPDSLKAKFNAEIFDSTGKSQSTSGVLFAVPGKRYRFELSGPMGLGGASLLWLPESWTLTISSERAYMKGAGYMVGDVSGVFFPLVNVHQLAAFFWGSLLPEGAVIKSSKDTLGTLWLTGVDGLGNTFYAAQEKYSRHITWLKTGNTDIRFSKFREYDYQVLPSEIAISRNGRKYLNLEIKSVKTDTEWSEGTWRLVVPKNYQSLIE